MTGALSAVVAALVAAFNPGADGSAARSICEREWNAGSQHGERITLQFDLPDERARMTAAQLQRHAEVIADSIRLGDVNRRLVDVSTWVNADGVFTVDALVLQA